jgi:hypothetical protein
MASFLPLHVRTAILEELDWDEAMTDEAIARAEAILGELFIQGVSPIDAPSRVRKSLSEEYSRKVVDLLIEYLASVAVRIQNTGEA